MRTWRGLARHLARPGARARRAAGRRASAPNTSAAPARWSPMKPASTRSTTPALERRHGALRRRPRRRRRRCPWPTPSTHRRAIGLAWIRAAGRRPWWPGRGTAAACRWPSDRACRRGPPFAAEAARRTRCSAWFELSPRLVEQHDAVDLAPARAAPRPGPARSLVPVLRGPVVVHVPRLVLAHRARDQVVEAVAALEFLVGLEMQRRAPRRRRSARPSGRAGSRPPRPGFPAAAGRGSRRRAACNAPRRASGPATPARA